MAAAVFLLVVSHYNYLLFHSLAELFAVIVAALACVVAWHSYPFSRNAFLMYLGCGYFWIGVLDGVHTLVYKGMGVFPITAANPATQFWIATRFCEALLLFTAPLFVGRPVSRNVYFALFGAGSAVLYTLIMSGHFPDAFIEGEGLTPFKIGSEYVVIAILAAALFHLTTKRQVMERRVFLLLVASIILTMVAELVFTLCVGVYDGANLAGHIIKLFSFWLVFVAIVRDSLRKPYLALEQRVEQRTDELRRINSSLEAEVTERLKAEQALRAAKEEAEFASHAKTEFLAHMSHEVRTPLTSIIGYAEMLENRIPDIPEDERLTRYSRNIAAAGNHLLAIVTDILDVSRIEAGKIGFCETRLNLNEIGAASLRLMQERAREARIKLSMDIPADLPGIMGDATRIKQILINLISNGIKFTPEGGRVDTTARVDGSGGMTVTVSDTGIGMDAEDIPRALEPFEQLFGTTESEHHGTGLGLHISRALMELHDGTLSISSQPGKGTEVTIRFPPERVIGV